MTKRSNDYFAKTLEKGIKILNLFDESNPAWSQTAIAEKIGMNMTSTYRLVNTFIEMGYLTKDPKTKQLRLGPMAAVLGNKLLSGFDVHELVRDKIDAVSARYQISVEFYLFQNDTLIQIHKRETLNTLTYHQDLISSSLYYTASGKAVLSALDDERREELIKNQPFTTLTEKTITDADSLRRDLKAAQRRGYAINDGEYIKGLIAIATPVISTGGKPIGAVCFTSTTLNFELDELEKQHSALLSALAKELAGLIGQRYS